ncbi:MAG: hypothetical protein GY720_06780 [bacterium]|nr:hypothetical protein [bacterium]
MQFLVADWPDGDEEQTDVQLRLGDPSLADLHAALNAAAPIHYGTHFVLSGSPAGELRAICTSGPFAAPDEPGTFLLYVDDELVTNSATRSQALAHLASGLDAV